MPNRPPSAFTMGQRVRVVLGKGGPARVGTVWHFQAGRYDHHLEAGGRYAEGDLRADE
jgi:hypothetical protein